MLWDPRDGLTDDLGTGQRSMSGSYKIYTLQPAPKTVAPAWFSLDRADYAPPCHHVGARGCGSWSC
jgi:hypothetical protein